jgi:hypothetical protein
LLLAFCLTSLFFHSFSCMCLTYVFLPCPLHFSCLCYVFVRCTLNVVRILFSYFFWVNVVISLCNICNLVECVINFSINFHCIVLFHLFSCFVVFFLMKNLKNVIEYARTQGEINLHKQNKFDFVLNSKNFDFKCWNEFITQHYLI